VRPPEEIAADCENVHGGEYRSLLREAAEALRILIDKLDASHLVACEQERVERLSRQSLEADRDALLAVARAAHTAWYNDARYSVQVEEAIAALPEHLRQQVEQT
jgi:hypothetical protein